MPGGLTPSRPAFGVRLLQTLFALLSTHADALVLALLAAAVVLRVLLVLESPTPFGYVWDFYTDGVRILYEQGRLPTAEDCWVCSHPPVFFVLGWPFYALGRWLDSGPSDATALRWLGGLAMASGVVTVYYGYRLLRLFRCRGASLVAGLAVLLIFPCLFISSYDPEADVVLAAILSAFIFHLARYAMRPARASAPDLIRLGALAGAAALTKYSGLIGVVTALITIGTTGTTGTSDTTGPPNAPTTARFFRTNWLRPIRHAVIVAGVALVICGWTYAENLRKYGTPFHANGSAAQGLELVGSRRGGMAYEFTTLRLVALRDLFGPRPPEGQLTSFPVYRSVLTSLHALAWGDMSFFSVPSRHGDPSRPYPRKALPPWLPMTVVVLGLVPEALAVVGIVATIRRRAFRPLAIFTVVSLASYVWWFLPQESWALKTKYILFLLPPLTLYMVSGLGWLTRRSRAMALAAVGCLAALVIVAHAYLFAFAVGRW